MDYSFQCSRSSGGSIEIGGEGGGGSCGSIDQESAHPGSNSCPPARATDDIRNTQRLSFSPPAYSASGSCPPACATNGLRKRIKIATILTASTSSVRLRSSSLRSSSKDSCCSNWRSGCWSGHSRSSNACAGQWGECEGWQADQECLTPEIAGSKERPCYCFIVNCSLGDGSCTTTSSSAAGQPPAACLAHGEAQLGGGGPALAQADLEQGARDAGRVLRRAGRGEASVVNRAGRQQILLDSRFYWTQLARMDRCRTSKMIGVVLQSKTDACHRVCYRHLPAACACR